MASKRQIAANRRNALLGGPKTSEGKEIVRLNARKHGIFAEALTKYDQAAMRSIHEELAADIRPVGMVEELLVEKLALTYLRMQRLSRAEAEYHISTWERRDTSDNPYLARDLARKKKAGFHVTDFKEGKFERMITLVARYDTALSNQFFKILHEIERYQRLRSGDRVPAPLVADVTHHESAESEPLPTEDGTQSSAKDTNGHEIEALPDAPPVASAPPNGG